MLSTPSARREALEAATSLLEELAEAHAEVAFIEDGEDPEYTDPGDFADAVLNNLPAIAYALNAGLPVIGWSPVQKNTAESERVLRAVRQWSEQARSLIESLAAGVITQDQFWEAMANAYIQHSTNSFMAGRRSVGNLTPLSVASAQALAAQQQADLARLQAQQAQGAAAGGGALAAIVHMFFDPANFVGSGLPGDPLKLLGGEGGKAVETMSRRVEQFGRSIASTANLGEMSGLEGIPEDAVIVWWELGDTDHCVDCIQLADLSPYKESTLLQNGLFPGSGHTQCGSNCACALNYDLPSDVCGDTLRDSDVLDDIGESAAPLVNLTSTDKADPFMVANDGRRFDVWVQEAASCSMPMSVGSFAGDISGLELLDDDEAFEWDDDLAMAIDGDADDTAELLSQAIAAGDADTFAWLSEYLDAPEMDIEQISTLLMKAEKVTYRFAWRETPTHVVFDFGRTTHGLTTLDPEMTMKALAQLSAKAAKGGKELLINAETAGPGMAKWLDSIATDRIAGLPKPPTVVPKWDFVPKAEIGPVKHGPAETLTPKQVDALADRLKADYGDWVLNLTPDETAALTQYQQDGGGFLSNVLRKGASTKVADSLAVSTGKQTVAEQLAALDSALAKATLPETVTANGMGDLQTVFRGVTDKRGVPTVGSLVTDPGYMSTSIDQNVAADFAIGNATSKGGKPVVYRIAVPEGTTGAYLDEFLTDLGYEREILMPRGLTFRVQAVQADAVLRDDVTGYLVDLVPEAAPVPKVLPEPPAKTLLPATSRADAGNTSYIGTNRAAWQSGFKPATKYEDAVDRLSDLVGGDKNHLGEFSLSQINVILARAELLDDMGFDLARVARLDDFAKVPDNIKHGRVGLTKGHTIAIRQDTKWQFFPDAALDQHPTVYDDIGGAFAHEYGHVLLADMSADGRKAMDAIRDANPGVKISDYAAEDADEWFGEVISQITQPGYKKGTLAFDQDVYRVLDEEHLLKQSTIALDPIGPPIPLADPAKGIKPGDPQQYLVGDNPLPVNAPLAEWSGYIPDEPALPAGLKASPAEVASAKQASDAAFMDWNDVASGRTEVALSWGQADRTEAEKAGLIYREFKRKDQSPVRFIARDETAAQKTEKWLATSGHSAQSDDFWLEVLGYDHEQLAAIDTYDALKKGGKRLSAGVLMVEPDGRVWVLTPKNEFAGYQNTWVKGGVDDGETAAAAAVREMREETGFTAELDSFLGDYMNTDKTGITRMYIGHRTGGGPLGAHLKETYKVKLMTEDEAAKALTRYGKPDARDQTILADAMKALKGETPTTHYVIGTDEVGTFTEMLAPKPHAKRIGQPKWDAHGRLEFAINPRPIATPQPSAAFAYDKGYIDAIGAHVNEVPPATKFPYAQSQWKLPDGQVQPMYWKVEPSGNTLFWANSKKQVADPHLRFNLHVAQLKNLLGKMDEFGTFTGLRVNEALLDQVPQLREMLIAAGATKSGATGAMLELSAGDAHALLTSLVDDVPLPKAAPSIATAPMVPQAKAVIEGTTVQPSSLAEMLESGSATVGEGDVTMQHAMSWSVNQKSIQTTWAHYKIADGAYVAITGEGVKVSVDKAADFLATQIVNAVHIIETHPGMPETTAIRFASSFYPNSSQRLVTQPLLDALGAKTYSTGVWEIDIDAAKAFAAKAKTEMAALGADPAMLSLDWAPLKTPQALPGATSLTQFSVDVKSVGQMTGQVDSLMVDAGTSYRSLVWTHPLSGAKYSARFHVSGSTLRWDKHMTLGTGVYPNAPFATRTLHYLGDYADLHPEITQLVIGADAYKVLPSPVRDMLEAFGGNETFAIGAQQMTMDVDSLKALRTAIGDHMPKPSINVPVGPLPVALDYEPDMVKSIGWALGSTSTGATAMTSAVWKGAYYIEGKTLRVSNFESVLNFPTVIEKRTHTLSALRKWSDTIGANGLERLEVPSALVTDEMRNLLLASGGESKALRIIIDRDALAKLAADITPPEATVAAAMAAAPDTVASYVGSEVAAATQAAVGSPSGVAALTKALDGAKDAKTTLGGAAMTQTDYGFHGFGTWRRWSNTLELHENQLSDVGLQAHVLRMAKAMDEAPKIEAFRLTPSSVANLFPSQKEMLLSAGAKEYVGGMRLTRAQTLALRDQIMGTAAAAEAKAAEIIPLHDLMTGTGKGVLPPKFEPVLGKQYGFASDYAAILQPEITPLKWDFVKTAFRDAADAKPLGTVKVRWLKKELLWDTLQGDPNFATDVAMARLRMLGDEMASHPNVERIRFTNLDQMPQSVKDMLNDYGALTLTTLPSGPVILMDRELALKMAADLDAEMKGIAGVKAPVSAAVKAPPAAAKPSIWTQMDASEDGVDDAIKTLSIENTAGGHMVKFGDGLTSPKMLIVDKGESVEAGTAEVMALIGSVPTPDQKVAFLQHLVSLVDVGEMTQVKVGSQALDMLGASWKELLVDSGAQMSGTMLVIDQSMALKISEAMKFSDYLEPLATSSAQDIVKSASLTAQFGLRPLPMGPTPDQVAAMVAAKSSPSKPYGNIAGISFDWLADTLTLEGGSTGDMLAVVAGIGQYPQGVSLAVKAKGTLADVLQAAGATTMGTPDYWQVEAGALRSLTHAIVDDKALGKVALGSTKSVLPNVEASLPDLLGHGYQNDPVFWSQVLQKPHTTTSEIGSKLKTVHWLDDKMGTTLALDADGEWLTWTVINTTGELAMPPETWLQTGIAQLVDIGEKLAPSTGAYADVTTVKIGQQVLDASAEIEQIALAYGGKMALGGITMSGAQAKALADAIAYQLMPVGLAHDYAAKTVGGLAEGGVSAAKDTWALANASSPTGIPGGLGYLYFAPVGKDITEDATPLLTAIWTKDGTAAEGMYVALTELVSAHLAAPVTGQALYDSAAKATETLVSIAVGQGSGVFVTKTVLDTLGKEGGLADLIKTWGFEKTSEVGPGVMIENANLGGLLAKLKAGGVNPLGYAPPVAVAEGSAVVSGAEITDMLTKAKMPTSGPNEDDFIQFFEGTPTALTYHMPDGSSWMRLDALYAEDDLGTHTAIASFLQAAAISGREANIPKVLVKKHSLAPLLDSIGGTETFVGTYVFDANKVDGALAKLLGQVKGEPIGAVSAVPESHLLDPYLTAVKTSDQKGALADIAFDAQKNAKTTELKYGFAKWEMPSGLQVKYRTSASTLKAEMVNASMSNSDTLATLFLLGDKVDSIATIGKVTFDKNWADAMGGLGKKMLGDLGGAAFNPETGAYVLTRDGFLKMRDAIVNDLKGLPTPGAISAPVTHKAAITYNVDALGGLGTGDVPALYGNDLLAMGLYLPGNANFAVKHGDSIAAIQLGTMTVDGKAVDDMMQIDLIQHTAVDTKQDVLAMLSAYGGDVMEGSQMAFFIPQSTLDQAPGLARILKPYGKDVNVSVSFGADAHEGLYFDAAAGNDLILHLYQGVPLDKSAVGVVTGAPKPTIAAAPEPLSKQLGWDMSTVGSFNALPSDGMYGNAKAAWLTWKDPSLATYVPAGGPAGSVHVQYRSYAGRFALVLQHGAGTEAQKAGAMWKSLAYLGDKAGTSGKAFFVKESIYATHPEIESLLVKYGAKAKTVKIGKIGDGLELTSVQAKKMAEDMLADVPVTGAPIVVKPAVAAAPAPVIKSAAQIEADALDDLVTASAVGKAGHTAGGTDTLLEKVMNGESEAVTVYKDSHGATQASMQWSRAQKGSDYLVTVEAIETGGAPMGAKVALADAASAAGKYGDGLLISDEAIAAAGIDDMGGLIYWSSANDAWTTSEPAKLADYLLGKQKPPVGAELTKPVVAAPPPPPVIVVPPKPSGLGDTYGYTHDSAKALADDPAAVTLKQVSETDLTKVLDTQWSNGITVRWAEEKMGDFRLLRVRAVSAGTPEGQANALVASLIGHWPPYLAEHPELDRILINKSALTNTPGLANLLKDSGWKETKDYWTFKRSAIGDLSSELAADKAAWMSDSMIPTSTPAGGWSGALPTTPSPSFIYDFNPANQKALYGQIVDKEIGALEIVGKSSGKSGGAGAGHELTVGKVKVQWSISPSGNTTGIASLVVDPAATNAEKVDAFMAALQKIAEDASNRSGNFFVKPEVYQQVPGLQQILKDAGASEEQFANLGDAIQMNAAQAKVLAQALHTDDMAGLTISISSSSDYLNYNSTLAATLFAKEPADLGKGVLRYETGATGAAKTAEARIALSADGKVGTLTDITADASVSTLTVAAQVNWFVTHGATDVTISSAILAKVPKLDKYLVSLGGKIEAGGIRLVDKALYDTRAALVKNALPVPLGGKALPFSFADSMVAAPAEVLQAVHSELVSAVGAKSVSEYLVGGRKIKVTFARSESNIYWEGIERGDANIGQMRSASVAQLRTFVNDMAQNANIARLDVGMDVLGAQPGLAAVLRKYGATEVAGTANQGAYLTLTRPKAMKLRLDIEKELGSAAGDPTTLVGKQAALIQWPTAEELSKAPGAAKLGGQTDKALLVDAKGDQWLFKPGASGQGAAADKAAAEIAALMGLPVPPVRVYTLQIDGKLVAGSLQKMVAGAKEIAPSLSSLTAKDAEALWQHSTLDWVIANDDAHIHNWLRDPEGNIWGIDKTRAWKTFLDPRRDVLDITSLGQGMTEELAPTFFKWWKDAKRNPQLLSMVHPTTMAKPLRALRAVDDATYRAIVTPFAKIAADANPRFKGDVGKMVEAMVERKNRAAIDMQEFVAKQLTEMKRAGSTIPADWEAWLKSGGRFNLDATPEDLLKERMSTLDAAFGSNPKVHGLSDQRFNKIDRMMHSGYGSGVQGAGSGGKVAFAAGHGSGSSHYGYEKVRPSLRSNPADAALAQEWEERNEWLVLHALFDADTSWVHSGSAWAKTLRSYYNPDKGTIRLIRSTAGYGPDPAKNLAGYTQSGFRNLMSSALGSHVTIGGHGGVYLYADVEPRQFFTSMFTPGFTAGESEVAIADLRIDQIVQIKSQASSHSNDATTIMAYNGPVVSVK